MVANYCYPLHKQQQQDHISKTLVDTYTHFVVKHLLPLVGSWRVGKGEAGIGGALKKNTLPPNFDECDLAADLMKEWRDTRGGRATFVASFDPAPERVKLMRNRSHSPKRTGVILVKEGIGGILERRWIDEKRLITQPPAAAGDDTTDNNTTEVPRKAVAPMAFSGSALISAAAKLKGRKKREQRVVDDGDAVEDGLMPPSKGVEPSGMTKEKAREFYHWLKELYEYTIAFEEWIKELSPINDAYDYLDRACGLPSGKVTINKLQSAARTAKFTDSPDAVNMLFYFLDINGIGYITRSAFNQWRNAREKTMESYMILSGERRRQWS
ncbi:hypothetical protein FOL47_000493 [Perkinsus chesapeaki]|uniref:Uncharacterized protein n=1 Tax=Perkinsus chesapeaki TaxID=330153 RepID=A0A7J6KWL6_PERCH|nr:hypothetical protein FOL47_000493 [Perkinsus chesapeaki]